MSVKLLNHYLFKLRHLLLLAIRVWLGKQLLMLETENLSGSLQEKIMQLTGSFEQGIDFTLQGQVAIVLSLMLLLGFGGRIGALGLIIILAVSGETIALELQVAWGMLLAAVVVLGSGVFSLEEIMSRIFNCYKD